MSHPTDIHVGKRLRLRRTILGMSQEAVGNAIGVTFQQIQKYERGKNRIGSSRLHDFAKILNVPVSFFFDEMEQTTPTVKGVSEDAQPFEHEKLSSRETMEFLRYYYRLPDNRRKKIFDLVKALADDKPIE